MLDLKYQKVRGSEARKMDCLASFGIAVKLILPKKYLEMGTANLSKTRLL